MSVISWWFDLKSTVLCKEVKCPKNVTFQEQILWNETVPLNTLCIYGLHRTTPMLSFPSSHVHMLLCLCVHVILSESLYLFGYSDSQRTCRSRFISDHISHLHSFLIQSFPHSRCFPSGPLWIPCWHKTRAPLVWNSPVLCSFRYFIYIQYVTKFPKNSWYAV